MEHTKNFTEVNENAELPTCTNPSPSTTAQSHVSQVNPFVGVTVGSTIAVTIILLLCFMLISVIFLLYKNKRNSPKRSTTRAVYSHGHLYQGKCLHTHISNKYMYAIIITMYNYLSNFMHTHTH